MDDLRYWIGFNLTPGIGPARLRALLDYFGAIGRAWEAPADELRQAGLDSRSIQSLIAARGRLDLERELRRVEEAEADVLTWDDPRYPRLLRKIDGAPPVLYVRGALEEADDWALAVVGTRRATSYGREATRRLVGPLAEAGLTIVSGLALGVDGEAHEAALDAGGRTLAVLGCGVDIVYPPEHRRLAERIIGQGALLSEYPLGTPPDARNFPPRNRIISGLARGVLVIEAGAGSGALITARCAAEQGREVFAVPGSILTNRHVGANMLITEGATLALSAEDILRALHLERLPQQRQARRDIETQAAPADATEDALLRCLSDEPRHIDEISRAAGLPVATVSSALALMELKGLVRQVGGMHYVSAS
jgi:DNA processing protein